MRRALNELIIRVRRWLVRKLGGFDAQHVTTIRTTQVIQKGHPRKVVATYTVPLGFVNPLNLSATAQVKQNIEFERVRQSLSRELADYIFNRMLADTVLLQCKDDAISMRREYRATLYVLPASEGVWLEGGEDT